MYLVGLTEVLRRTSAKRLIVMGDFNQTTGPGSRARPQLRLALRYASRLFRHLCGSLRAMRPRLGFPDRRFEHPKVARVQVR